MAARRSGGFRIKVRSSAFACICALAAVAQTPPKIKEFSHAKHLKLGNVAPVIASAIDKGAYLGRDGEKIRPLLNSSNPCVACHRGLENSDAVSRVNMPQMADCLVCHNTISPPDSCEFCHMKDAQLKPVNHVAGFLDSHTNKKSGLDLQTCAVCHARKFTCLGCHLK
jgi:hypothetical protein